MKIFLLSLIFGALSYAAVVSNSGTDNDRSRLPIPFSSSFRQPSPPTIAAEFRANWNQHKWDSNVSNIASGFLYNSPSQGQVRVDEAYDSTFASSLFDYANVTQEGVANRQWSLSPAITSPPVCFVGFTNPAFALISDDILVANEAIYAGVRYDSLAGEVALWEIMYQGVIPVTILLNEDNVVQGYDFLGPDTRARAVTRFFNIILGDVGGEVFDFPC